MISHDSNPDDHLDPGRHAERRREAEHLEAAEVLDFEAAEVLSDQLEGEAAEVLDPERAEVRRAEVGKGARSRGVPRNGAVRRVQGGRAVTGEADATIPDPLESPPPATVPEAPPIPAASGPAPAGGKRRGRSRAGTSTADRQKRPVGRPSNHAQRAERVAALYDQLGSMAQMAIAVPLPELVALRIYGAGAAVSENAAPIGEAWATWADTSPRVAALIDGLSFGGGALGVILAHVPIVLAIANPGPVDPEVAAFASQMRTMFTPAPGVDDGAPYPG